jgi:Spy/CpxP family protein refolding chaperone
MRHGTIVGMFLCSILFGAAAAVPHHDSTAAVKDSAHQKWWSELDLTADQKTKLKGLRVDMKEFRKANFEKMKALLDKSKDELLKAAPSKTVLYGYAKEMGELHRTEAEHMVDHMLKMKSVLTKEQFEKLIKMGLRRGPHGMDGKMHKGGPGGPPPDMDD